VLFEPDTCDSPPDDREDDDWEDEFDDPRERELGFWGGDRDSDEYDDEYDIELNSEGEYVVVAERGSDVAQVGIDQFRKRGDNRLSDAERRVKTTYGAIPTAQQAVADVAEIAATTGMESDHRRTGRGVSVRAGTASAVREAPSAGSAWLRDSASVETEVRNALAEFDLSLTQARDAFPSHRPTRQQRAVRETVRVALRPLYGMGAKRADMAAVLDISRQRLHDLLR
jgi:hypothetical protein